MNKLYRHMRKSNYDKYPSTKICGTIFQGWDSIRNVLADRLKGKTFWLLTVIPGCMSRNW